MKQIIRQLIILVAVTTAIAISPTVAEAIVILSPAPWYGTTAIAVMFGMWIGIYIERSRASA